MVSPLILDLHQVSNPKSTPKVQAVIRNSNWMSPTSIQISSLPSPPLSFFILLVQHPHTKEYLLADPILPLRPNYLPQDTSSIP